MSKQSTFPNCDTNTLTPSTQKWHNLIQNLMVFTSSATNLIGSLERAIEISKKESSGDVDEEFSCACSKLITDLGKFSVNENVPVAKNDIDELLAICCDSEEDKPDEQEKLVKIKEDLSTTQQNLTEISEEIRQLERLYQDYDSHNTKNGQVNVAALYKEIMKPQTVPFVRTDSSLAKRHISFKSTGTTSPRSPVVSGNMNFNNQPSAPSSVQQNVLILSAVPFRSRCNTNQ